MKKIQLVTASCTRRELELEQVRKYLVANGYELSAQDFETDPTADYIILSTCGFTQAAEDYGLKMIEKFEKEKKPECEILVGGCLPKIHKEVVDGYFTFDPRSYDKLDDFFGMKKKFNDFERPNYVEGTRINSFREHGITASNLDKLDDVGKQTSKENLEAVRSINNIISNNKPAVFRIQCMLGCACKCSYCAIKFAIGGIESRPINEIIEEIKKGMDQGFTAFLLEGDSLGGYGLDIHTDIGGLLDAVIQVVKDKPVQIGLPDISPLYLDRCKNQIIELAQLGKLYNFYVPLQSGSQRIINAMKRGYKIDHVVESIHEIRAKCKGMKLGTSIIVGFPGETEEDFMETIDVCKDIKFDYVYCHSYSDRIGTESNLMMPKIPADEILSRSRRLKELLKPVTPLITIAEDTAGNRTCQG